MNLEDHIGKQIESHSLTPAGGVVLTKLGSLYTVSPKLVEPDRDEGAVRVETTPHPKSQNPPKFPRHAHEVSTGFRVDFRLL